MNLSELTGQFLRVGKTYGSCNLPNRFLPMEPSQYLRGA